MATGGLRLNQEYKEEILTLIVEEAIEKDKAKGMIIDNPSGYFNYKMARARHQAKEDPAWLLQQRDRLIGNRPQPLGVTLCAHCKAPLPPSAVYELNDEHYCDYSCATGQGRPMSFKEFKEMMRQKGSMTAPRILIVNGRQEFGEEITVTYEDVCRISGNEALAFSDNGNDDEQF